MAGLSMQKVVVPVDFSELSFEALDQALELVGDAKRIHIVHVLPRMEITDPGVIWETIDDATRRKHAADAVRERLQGAQYRGVEIVVAIGDPGREITDYAQSSGADLIVISSHGRTGVSRLLIGSVAERVVRRAHCPVLVLKH